MKDRLPWFKCNPGALLSAMAGLSAEENLVYVTILLRIYETGGPIQETPRTIARRCGLTVPKAEAAIKGLIEFGKISHEGGYFDSASTHDTLAEMEDARKGASSAGKASAKARAEKDKQKQQNTPTPVEQPLNECSTTKDLREKIEESILSETSSDAPSLDLIGEPVDAPKRRRNEYPEDFEAFWRAYPTDANMSKSEAAKVWKKLDEHDRFKSQQSVPAFVEYCRKNRDYRPIHAERYLKQRRFDGFASSAPSNANAPKLMTDDQWRGLVRAYISTGGNWPWRDVSPEPGKPGCRVPRETLDEFRDDLKRIMWPEYFAAAFGLEFAGAAE